MQSSVRTIALGAVGVAIVAALAYVALRENPVPVDLFTVEQGPMQVTIDADGTTKVRDLYEISSPIDGTVMRSPVDIGDPVVGGETVVAIVQPGASALLDERTRLQAEATLQEARASLHLAEAEHRRALEDFDYAQTQFERSQALVERGVASVTRMEDATQRLAIAEAAVATANARIEMARGTIDRAQATLATPAPATNAPGACCVQLTSPIDGVVLSVDSISQRPVARGAPLVSVGDPAEIEIVADILSSEGVRLTPGAPAVVERWGRPYPLEARLDRIDPAARTKVSALGIEEQRVDAYLTLTSEPDERAGLGHGFSVFVRIVEWEAEDAVQVPVSALFRNGAQWAVFVVADATASLRLVDVGRRNDTRAEILSGLEPGEHVIMHPSDSVYDGAPIVERSEL